MSVRIKSASSANADQNLMPFRYALKAYLNEEKLKIPVLPDVISRVIELINHPTVNANTLARLIHKDQALAGYVLRVSNSPMYAGAKEIVTLRQAIARIGARTLGKIALSITMQGSVFKAKGYEAEMKSIWRSSLSAGALAQEIGNCVRYPSESLYLCGLLHTVGKPVILQALEDLKEEFDLPLSYEGGLQLMEHFYQGVGGKVAEQWKLPESVKNAALFYKAPEKSPTNTMEVRITYLADKLADFVDNEPDEAELNGLVADATVQALKITPDMLKDFVVKMEKIRVMLDAMTL